MPLHTLKGERVYLDAKGKATEDPSKGVELLGIAGDEITMEAAYAAGLVKTEPEAGEESVPTMLYYDGDGKRVNRPVSGGFQFLDNDPTRPDANAAPDSTESAPEDEYQTMKKDDLVALAEKRNVALPDKARVADIRTALRAADQKE